MKIWKILFYAGNIFVIILGTIVIYQIIKILVGGSWSVEDIILTIISIHFGLTIVMGGWFIASHNQLQNKISNIDKKLHGHLEWHKASGYNQKT